MRDTILVESKSTELAALIASTLRYRDLFAYPAAVPLPEDCAVKGIVSVGYGKPSELLNRHLPLLALGEDAALLCAHYHGDVSPEPMAEEIHLLRYGDDKLFSGIDDGEYRVRHAKTLKLPDCLVSICESDKRCIAFRHDKLPVYAAEYTVERNDPDAAQLLANFAQNICGCTATWQMEHFVDEQVEEIRRSLPEGLALCAMSGGVDSAVSADLAYRALGGRLSCIYIDTGLGREGEAELAIRSFAESSGIPTAYLDARQTFLKALTGISDEAEKQRITAQVMGSILADRIKDEPELRAIITGTNLNDLLYTSPAGSDPFANIQKLCPIRTLFKEEVRHLARELSLSEKIINRQPFPCSGLALRIMGEVNEQKLNVLRIADACFATEIENASLDRKLFQYFAALADNPDGRGGYAVCLRAVQAQGSRGIAARLPYDLMERTAASIQEKLPEVRRVMYDLSTSVHFREID